MNGELGWRKFVLGGVSGWIGWSSLRCSITRGERNGELDLSASNGYGDEAFSWSSSATDGRRGVLKALHSLFGLEVETTPWLRFPRCSGIGLDFAVNHSSSAVGVLSMGDSRGGDRSRGRVSSSSGHLAELRREYSEARRPLLKPPRFGCVVERGR
jgi:hypothetical protein